METEDLQSYDLEAVLQLLSAELEEADTYPFHRVLLVRTALSGLPLHTAGLPSLSASPKPNIFFLHLLRCLISHCCHIRSPNSEPLLTAIQTAEPSLYEKFASSSVQLSGTAELFSLVCDISVHIPAAFSSPDTTSVLESHLRRFSEDTYKREAIRIINDLYDLPEEPYQLFKRAIETTFGTLDWRKKLSDPSWSFWRDWYQGFLDGEPLDWELQHRVALIEYWVWDAGPEAVAAEIERIRCHFELEQEVARLKGQLAAVERTPAAALIGDNGGPPLDDAAARAWQTDLALIWKQVEELEEEIAKPSPSLSLLEKIAKTLWEVSLRMAAYCGSVADGMIREGTKELAKAGAKWTAGATAVTITAQTEGVQSVAKAIWAFVKSLQ